MKSRLIGKLTKWHLDKMAICPDNKLTKLQVDEMAIGNMAN